MEQALAGDQRSYQKLLMDLKPWLNAYFGKRLQTNAAEDLTQETLLSLHAKRHTYDPAQPFGPWISAVARYRMIDYFRKIKRSAETEFDEAYQGVAPSHGSAVRDKLDVENLLKHLSAEQAQVIDLVKLQQYSIAEAAQQTGRSESAIKVMIHRAIKKMAEQLNKGKDSAS